MRDEPTTDRTSARTGHPRLLITAAVLWLLAAVVYVGSEAIAASAFPGYSYAVNYISDLGIPTVGEYDGRTIDSPLSAVMNSGFIHHGVLWVLAALAAVVGLGTRRPRLRWFFVGAAALHCLGSILIGVVPGSQESAASGAIGLHVLGAAFAILGGNAATILGGSVLRSAMPAWHRAFSIVVGSLGIASVVVLQLQSTTGLELLPDGVWERASVYAITVWEVTTAVVLLRSRGSAR